MISAALATDLAAAESVTTYADATYVPERAVIAVDAGGDLGPRLVELIFPSGEIWQIRSRKYSFSAEPRSISERRNNFNTNSAAQAIVDIGVSALLITTNRVLLNACCKHAPVKFSEKLDISIRDEALYRRSWQTAIIRIWYGEPGKGGLPGTVVKSIYAPAPVSETESPKAPSSSFKE